MTIPHRIITRKIGAFELLVGAFPLEFVFGTTSRAVLLLTLSVGFYFAKKEFRGEFSLRDGFALFSDEKPKDPK